MDNEVKFDPFPKIPRWSRTITVTEKCNGSNAGIYVAEDFVTMKVASRTRWIVPGDDNFGFAKWATEHEKELLTLGPGMHFGEWYGRGIQCNYGLKERRFALFNTKLWSDPAKRPACCDVVPVLYEGPNDEAAVLAVLDSLRADGSRIAPGFMQPEGIIIYHHALGGYFKKTLLKDAEWKGKSE